MKYIMALALTLISITNATDYYDKYGHRTGRATVNDNTVKYYDQYGHLTGRSK